MVDLTQDLVYQGCQCRSVVEGIGAKEVGVCLV